MITPVALLVAFQGRPEPDWLPVLDAPRNLTHVLQLPAPQHPGSKLEIRGTVLKRDGKSAAAGIVLYFHHTDARGVYPGRSAANPNDWTHWHGTLRGWLKTDAQGRYLLRTTRPAPYPGGAEPAHIHVYGVASGSRQGFMFNDILFDGDRLINDEYWARVRRFGTKPYPGIKLTKRADGTLVGQWDFVLPTDAR